MCEAWVWRAACLPFAAAGSTSAVQPVPEVRGRACAHSWHPYNVHGMGTRSGGACAWAGWEHQANGRHDKGCRRQRRRRRQRVGSSWLKSSSSCEDGAQGGLRSFFSSAAQVWALVAAVS